MAQKLVVFKGGAFNGLEVYVCIFKVVKKVILQHCEKINVSFGVLGGIGMSLTVVFGSRHTQMVQHILHSGPKVMRQRAAKNFYFYYVISRQKAISLDSVPSQKK